MEAAFERHSTCLMEVLTVYCDREDDSGITEVNAEIEAAEKKYCEANERYLDELAEERYSRSSGSRSVHSVRSQVRGRVETAVSGRNPRQSVGAASRINSDSNKWRERQIELPGDRNEEHVGERQIELAGDRNEEHVGERQTELAGDRNEEHVGDRQIELSGERNGERPRGRQELLGERHGELPGERNGELQPRSRLDQEEVGHDLPDNSKRYDIPFTEGVARSQFRGTSCRGDALSEKENLQQAMRELDDLYVNRRKDIRNRLRSVDPVPDPGFAPESREIGRDMWKQLSRVNIPTFSGDKKTYAGWRAAFYTCVDAAPATAEYKLLQLRSYLRGEALKAIESLGHSPAAYEAAKTRLDHKFGGSLLCI